MLVSTSVYKTHNPDGVLDQIGVKGKAADDPKVNQRLLPLNYTFNILVDQQFL